MKSPDMENQETIDEERGEVGIELGGKTYPMAATYDAVKAIERDIGSILGISARLRSYEQSLTLNEIAVIVTRSVQAAGKERDDEMLKAFSVDKVGRSIYKIGVSKVMQPLTRLLYRMLSGTNHPGGDS